MEYSGNDFFCDVALKGLTPLEVILENELVLAFNHTRPAYPIHIVVIPKKHIQSFSKYSKEDAPVVIELLSVASTIASDVEEKHGAARVITNCGGYQDSKHLHVHVVFGEKLV
jgi:histidine triad (HIT) family protein